MDDQSLPRFLSRLNSELINSQLETIPCLKQVVLRMAKNMEYEDEKSHQQLKEELEFCIFNLDHEYIRKFLNLSDMSYFFINRGIFSNIGRGSQNSSMICYALKITKANPTKHNFDWERFLNKHYELILDLDVHPNSYEDFIKYLKNKFAGQIYYGGSEGNTNINRSLKTILDKEYKYSFSKSQSYMNEIEKQVDFNFPGCHEMEREEIKRSTTFLELLNEKSILFMELFSNHPDLYEKIHEKMTTIKWRGKHASQIIITDKDMSSDIVENNKDDDIPILKVSTVKGMPMQTYHVLRITVLNDINEFIRSHNISGDLFEYMNFSDSRVFSILNDSSFDLEEIFHLKNIKRFKKIYPEFRFTSMESISEYLALTHHVDSYIEQYKSKGFPPEKYETILKKTNGHLLYQEQILDILRLHNLDPVKYFKLFMKNRIRYEEVKEIMTEKEFAYIHENAMTCFLRAHSMAYAHYTYLNLAFKYVLHNKLF